MQGYDYRHFRCCAPYRAIQDGQVYGVGVGADGGHGTPHYYARGRLVRGLEGCLKRGR